MKKEDKYYTIKTIHNYGRCLGKTMQMKQNARDYYSKNESTMTKERKIEFKRLFEELWGEKL